MVFGEPPLLQDANPLLVLLLSLPHLLSPCLLNLDLLLHRQIHRLRLPLDFFRDETLLVFALGFESLGDLFLLLPGGFLALVDLQLGLRPPGLGCLLDPLVQVLLQVVHVVQVLDVSAQARYSLRLQLLRRRVTQ